MVSQQALPQAPSEPRPLVPIFIAVDREGLRLREDILWPVSEGSAAKAAARLCAECFLPPGYERQVEAQIDYYVEPYRAAHLSYKTANAGQPFHDIEVTATHEQQVFRDRVQWDAAEPPGSEARYAARVAADLGLDWGWQCAIASALRQQLQAATSQPAGSTPQPGRGEAVRMRTAEEAADSAGLPRVETLHSGRQRDALGARQLHSA
ncbi:hypothetical protein WJX81_002934 [Elliptochloris bilobata]|uniref:Uncharacterized protein n=1 Tax=Elliptochloris bilobata TaxID=381761 RepID=A0AAW1SHH6_9CHLO